MATEVSGNNNIFPIARSFIAKKDNILADSFGKAAAKVIGIVGYIFLSLATGTILLLVDLGLTIHATIKRNWQNKEATEEPDLEKID